jgi:hypothetical protein
MKKTIMILAMAAMSFSCSTEEQQTNNSNCDCGEVIQSTSFNVVDGSGGVNVFSVVKIKNYCTEIITQTQLQGNIPLGSEICN